jgi:putative transport protein
MALFSTFADALRQYPELAIFLTVGIGFWIGAVRFGPINLGAVTGALFAGLVIGQLEITISSTVKSALFLLFLFANGYAVGPQFLNGLKRDGIKPLALVVVQCSAGLAVCILAARLLGFDPGLAGGLLAGALTQSPAIGTASEAISALPLPEEIRARMIANVAIGNAITYVFGTFGAIWFLSRIAPRMLGIDLREEARALECSLGIKSAAHGIISAYRPFAVRACRIGAGAGAKSVRDFEASLGSRLFVLRLRRNQEIMDIDPAIVVGPGDVVVLGGRRGNILSLLQGVGEEVHDPELLDIPLAAASVLVTSPLLTNRPLGELAALPETRNIGLRRITRLGRDIPILPGNTLNRGDLIEIVGPEKDVAKLANLIGRAVKAGVSADLGAIGIGIVLGGLIGSLHFVVGSVPVGLGTSVGTLLAGVATGHLAATRPGFGVLPDAAIDLMRTLGLSAFIGITGLQAAPYFVAALRESGAMLLLAGCVCTVIPLLIGVLFGRYFLKMNPVLLLAASAGAQTTTPSLAAIQERAGSQTPVLGYTVPYAIGQIVMTLWGSAIVILIA